MQLDRLSTDLELKSVDLGARVISGHAAVIGNLDRVGDIIDGNAFTKMLTEKKPADIGVFVGHQTSELPIGIPLSVSVDSKGLWTETYVFEGPVGDNVLQVAKGLLKYGKTLGMSVGYRTRDSRMERVNGKMIRRLLDIDVVEYSIAASQSIANPEALISGVKARKQGSQYTVAADGDQWVVTDTDDGDTVGTYADQATAQAVAAALNAELAEEMDDEPDDMPMGGMGKGKTAATKAVWSAAEVNDLPDSSFLYITPGGQKDDEGKTVPRANRHFPYKDAEGKIDLPHLRNAIARIPQSDAPGLNKDALQARAQRMLADAQGGKTVSVADDPEWQQGAVPTLAFLGYKLLAAADDLAASQKAMVLLGEDTKLGARMQAPMRAKLREAIQTLTDVVNWAETVDAEKDAAAKVALYRRQMELQQLDLVAS